jgi:type III restriction enzyme
MNRTAQSIKNRLSLRPPQAESLNILAKLCDSLTIAKNTDLEKALNKVSELYPTCTDFEREFPSLCFALATGVGKTRLMGAFIAWLYLELGKKNFFVLAPNLTIYNKLIQDFGNPAHSKYVFRGIGEFVNNQPRIITGENYLFAAQTDQFDAFSDAIHINIFNISKINAETRGNRAPRMKRLSEYLGESYFNYLANLPDLVLLMDESHHYRADRGMQVINELQPILGLEVTATPQVERSGNTIKFKNVVYEYSLARAIQDGFVKEPAVATRRDFDPEKFSGTELDRIKLEDGIRLHEDTKVALDIYARDNHVDPVKPFVLVVAKDTQHASDLIGMIKSPSFFEGYYMDKVMEIHSNQRGSEKEENIENLISLESPDNIIEIVIHVNMLKEGWDVNNLYTIIPLRTAASLTLREQTIGRGLRLPYGKRTHDPKVDKLTIVAHDRFQEIIEEANRPGSIIKKENIIEIDESGLNQTKHVISSVSNIDHKLQKEEQHIATLKQSDQPKAKETLALKKVIYDILPGMNKSVNRINDLSKKEIKAAAVARVKERLASPQGDIFAKEQLQAVETLYDEIVDDYIQKIIEIPRISIMQSKEVESGFHDFDLDTKNLNFQPGSEEIIVHTLQNGIIEIIESGQGHVKYQSLENIIISELINYPEIDYDEHADLLFKLTSQALDKFRSYLSEDLVPNVLLYHKKEIGKFIHTQLMAHFYYKTPDFQEPVVRPFTRIESHNYSKYTKDQIYDFRETINPTQSIPSKIFSGFKKACHTLYKFESKTEKDFAIILEQEDCVIKWLRPASNQFHIYYNQNSQRYKPDFVAETTDTIYLVETKKASDIETPQVSEKAQAAMLYCARASKYTADHGGKPWKYILIPHNSVKVNMSLKTLVERFEYCVEKLLEE